MINSVLLLTATFIYGLAALFYIISWIFQKEIGARIAAWITILGFAGNTAGILMRWIESYQLGLGRAPLYNRYEFLILFSWVIVFIFLLLERRYKTVILGAFSSPLAFLAMAYACLSPNISHQIQPLIPALKSKWLLTHVATCVFAYAAFTIAIGINCVYFFRPRNKASTSRFLNRIPSTDILDNLTHLVLTFGFFLLLAGIYTGAVWAKSAWGRYWGWDPKETWSLLTGFSYIFTLFVWFIIRRKAWENIIRALLGILISVMMLITAILLLLVLPIMLKILFAFFLISPILMKKLGVDQRTISAVYSILSFGILLFTWFGVNLLPGLHSYGSI
jgi:cytochrome c-type biogenesis protein CcsB